MKIQGGIRISDAKEKNNTVLGGNYFQYHWDLGNHVFRGCNLWNTTKGSKNCNRQVQICIPVVVPATGYGSFSHTFLVEDKDNVNNILQTRIWREISG